MYKNNLSKKIGFLLPVLVLLISLSISAPSSAMWGEVPDVEPKQSYSSINRKVYKTSQSVSKNNNPVTSQPSLINPYTITAATALLGIASYGAYSAYSWLFEDEVSVSEIEQDQKYAKDILKNFEEDEDLNKWLQYCDENKRETDEEYTRKKISKEASKAFKESIGECTDKNYRKEDGEKIEGDLYSQSINDYAERKLDFFEDNLFDDDNYDVYRISPPTKSKENLDFQLPDYIIKAAGEDGAEGNGRENANEDENTSNETEEDAGAGIKAEVLYKKVNNLFNQKGKEDEALKLFNKILNNENNQYESWLQDPQNRGYLYYIRGRVLNRLERHADALNSFNEIYNNQARYKSLLNPRNRDDLYFRRGLVLINLERYEDALNSFNEIYNNQAQYESWIQNSLNRYRLYHARGLILINLGRYEDALNSFNEIYNNQAQYKSCLQKPQRMGNLYFNRGSALNKLGRYTEALNCFNEILYNKNNQFKIWLQTLSNLKKLYNLHEQVYSKLIKNK